MHMNIRTWYKTS